MGLNFVIPTSICLEFSILIWQLVLHVYMQSSVASKIWFVDFFKIFDSIFFGCILFLYFVSFYWAFYFWPDRHRISKHVTNFRYAEGILFVVGGMISTMNVIFILVAMKWDAGEVYEGKLVVGSILFITFVYIDGALYFMNPSYKVERNIIVLPVPELPDKATGNIVLDGFGNVPNILFGQEEKISEKY